MKFDSLEYLLVFLPVTVILYHLVRTRTLFANLVILSASYVFYAWGSSWVLLLLIFSSVADYFIGNAIYRAPTPAKRKFFLVASCVFNLGFLSIFKYGNWISVMLHSAWHTFPILDVPLPYGISFYTFQSLSYTIDIYRRRLKPQGTIVDYLSFVSFFPHLVAGPILKAVQTLPQLERVRPKVHPKIAEKAFFMIVWGLFKKMVCADNLGMLVSMCRDKLDRPGAGLILVLAFTFQIYCDFSAYTDIARGTARLFGVRIPRNFMTPYFSRSPSEFWSRWHISLSTWIRDYLYIPLGGNRGSRLRACFNLLVTMFLAGLWHGAGKFFIFWGLYHGLLLILYRFAPLEVLLPRLLGRVTGNIMAWAIMFVLVVEGWILFFSDRTKTYDRITHSLLQFFTHPIDTLMPVWAWGLALYTVPIILSDIIGYRARREFVDVYLRLSLVAKIALYMGLFYAIVFFAARDTYDFIYFRF